MTLNDTWSTPITLSVSSCQWHWMTLCYVGLTLQTVYCTTSSSLISKQLTSLRRAMMVSILTVCCTYESRSQSALSLDCCRSLVLSCPLQSHQQRAVSHFIRNQLSVNIAINAPLWNNLPDDIVLAGSLWTFWRQLKRHLFEQSYRDDVL